jgi:hypothetical protein
MTNMATTSAMARETTEASIVSVFLSLTEARIGPGRRQGFANPMEWN